MSHLALYAMTRKGVAAVRGALAAEPRLVSFVVGAHDDGVDDDCYDAIKELCHVHGVRHFDRGSVNLPEAPWTIAVSWRWLLDSARTNLIVLHDSLLPRLRGFNPLVTALINGDSHVGVTALMADEGVDSGDIIMQRQAPVGYPIRICDAIALLEPIYESLARSIIEHIGSGRPMRATPQDASKATYSLWRNEEDYLIDWGRSAAYIRRFVDAVGPPYRGASAWLGSELVRVLAAEEVADLRIENRTPGKVFSNQGGAPVVVCGVGMLRITELVDDSSGQTLLPLSRLRLRFGNTSTPETRHVRLRP